MDEFWSFIDFAPGREGPQCPNCGYLISKSSAGCPICRRSEKKIPRGVGWAVIAATLLIVALIVVALTTSCSPSPPGKETDRMTEFATRYTAAWCSQDAASVASFFAEDGSLKINDGEPSIGRGAITVAARGFMTAFPDLVVAMDGISVDGDRAVYRWTLTGINTGPGGTGNPVRISGYEEWTIDAAGLIKESLGHFDEAEYQRQLEAGDGS